LVLRGPLPCRRMCRAVSRDAQRFVNSVGHCHADPEHPRLRCPGATFRHELRGDRRRCRDAASGLLDVCVYHGCPCSSEQCAWNLQLQGGGRAHVRPPPGCLG
ncbi:unnamed protein product, partial [Symbiodinium sp. CCMP2456]